MCYLKDRVNTRERASELGLENVAPAVDHREDWIDRGGDAAVQHTASDGTQLTIASDSGYRGRSMRLDFDFRGGGGYVIARRAIPITFPANYEVRFRVRGNAPANNLEIKFVDRSGAPLSPAGRSLPRERPSRWFA